MHDFAESKRSTLQYQFRTLLRASAILLAFSLTNPFRGQVIAGPQDDEARAAVQAFLENPAEFRPNAASPWLKGEISMLAEGAKLNMLGPAKLVYTDGKTAIVAVGASFPGLVQTIYVRVRRSEGGGWLVTDWSSLQELQNNALMIATLDKASPEEWRKTAGSPGAIAEGNDIETVRNNMRLLLGSDEEFLAGKAPSLDAVKAFCRAVASTAGVGPVAVQPLNPGQREALDKKASGDPALAKLLAEARRLGIATFWREEGSGVVSLAGVAPDGRRQKSMARHLLCTPDTESTGLATRLSGPKVVGIRDLGDHIYFLRDNQ